jgi:hypothetical protein
VRPAANPAPAPPALLVLLVALLGASACGGPQQWISIEFGLYPEEFEGLPVLIDGEQVGTLDVTGRATRIAFPVEMGEHEVRIEHPELPCRPAVVNVRLKGEKIRLMADLADFHEDGRIVPTIVLQ